MKTDTKFIIFKIDTTQSLIIKNLCYEGDHLYRYDPIIIVFKNENSEYILSRHDYLIHKLDQFYDYLKDAIKNKLSILKSIKADLGYLWNQDLHQRNSLSYEISKKKERWKGTRYLMWGGGEFDTWLYNQNNKIYLEITPCYEWFFDDPTEGDNYVSYDEWIKNYKPLISIEIDKITAQQWYDQAGKIMQEIEKADEKYLHTSQE